LGKCSVIAALVSTKQQRESFRGSAAIEVPNHDLPGFAFGRDPGTSAALWSMQSGQKNAYGCIKAFSKTDFTKNLKKLMCPRS